jgi:MoaA/NifB/PqqE/SkfB family radical SAM enzyme
MSVYRENQLLGGFTQLSMDISSRCNYDCDWCFNKHLLNKQEKDLLTLPEKKAILKEAKSLGAKTLVIPGTGEPTLDPDFYPLVKIANSLGLITVVYSNLTGNLDEQKIQYLFNHNVSIGIKLDSFSAKYFLERYKTTLDVQKRFLLNLSKVLFVYKNSTKKDGNNTIHRVIANMVLTLENTKELPQIQSFCRKYQLPLFMRPVKSVYWAKEAPKKWRVIGNKAGGSLPGSKLIKLANKYNTLFSPSSTLENHCAIYSFGLTIKNNGDFQSCPDHHDSRKKLGNIRELSLREASKNLLANRTIKPGFCVMMPAN